VPAPRLRGFSRLLPGHCPCRAASEVPAAISYWLLDDNLQTVASVRLDVIQCERAACRATGIRSWHIATAYGLALQRQRKIGAVHAGIRVDACRDREARKRCGRREYVVIERSAAPAAVANLLRYGRLTLVWNEVQDGWRILVSFKGAAVAFASFRSRFGNSLIGPPATHSIHSL